MTTKQWFLLGQGKGGKSLDLTDIIKQLFQFTMSRNVVLEMQYIQSELNPVDLPSRSLSAADSHLHHSLWEQVNKV